MADLRTAHANEVDSLNRLVDSFAIKNATLELFDANTQELLVLPFDLAAACFVFGQVGVFVASLGHLGVPVQIAFGGLGLVDFRHARAPSVI